MVQTSLETISESSRDKNEVIFCPPHPKKKNWKSVLVGGGICSEIFPSEEIPMLGSACCRSPSYRVECDGENGRIPGAGTRQTLSLVSGIFKVLQKSKTFGHTFV